MLTLNISNLSKTYPNGVQALKNISLDIPQGMFGLLGPNGAGKSTLMRTIATLQEADSGSIHFGEINIKTQKNALRKVLGYLPQQFGVYPKISPELLLSHLAVLKGFTNNKERKMLVTALLHKVNLFEVRKQKLGSFSGGMKQRFGIAQALLNNPKLLIVDEPTAGLDPVERNRFYNLLSDVSENTIVILSTHIVDDIKQLCPNMAIINEGQVVLTGNPIQIIKTLHGKIFEKTIERNQLSTYKKEYQVINERFFLGQLIIRVFSERKLNDGFQAVEAQLEDVYLSRVINP